MKRLTIVVGVLLLILSVVRISQADDSVGRFNGDTKADVIVYIEKSLSDPQISDWVVQKFHSKALFMKAVKLAPENIVRRIAVSFSDFQKVGGEINDNNWGNALAIFAFLLGLGVLLFTLAAL